MDSNRCRSAIPPETREPWWESVSDQEAIAATLSGRREFFEALARRYNQRLYRVGMGFLKRRADVEDAMQETYLNAYRNLSRFRGNSQVGTWLTRIMINQCRMRLRKQGRAEAAMETIWERENFSPKTRSGPQRELSSTEISDLLERSIARLPRSYRSIYLLREVEGISNKEIADCLEISETNVKVRLHRAREALKSLLLETADEQELFAYPAPFCNPLTAAVLSRIQYLDASTGAGDS